jgi:hypothetical protein
MFDHPCQPFFSCHNFHPHVSYKLCSSVLGGVEIMQIILLFSDEIRLVSRQLVAVHFIPDIHSSRT